MLKLAVNGLVSFSAIPLRVATGFGFLIACCSLFGIIVVLYFKLFTDKAIPGWAATVIPMLFLGGVQLLSIGIMGEYIAQIFSEVKQRPLYLVKDMLGLEADSPSPGLKRADIHSVPSRLLKNAD